MVKGLEIDVDKLRREVTGRRVGAKIADELGISRFYLYRKLSGKIAFGLRDLNRVCGKLGIDASEFVCEVEIDLEAA